MMRSVTDWIYDGANEAARKEGRDWPARAHTMIGLKRLANLRFRVETVLEDDVPGKRFRRWTACTRRSLRGIRDR